MGSWYFSNEMNKKYSGTPKRGEEQGTKARTPKHEDNTVVSASDFEKFDREAMSLIQKLDNKDSVQVYYFQIINHVDSAH